MSNDQKTVLVTGSTGQTGSQVTKQLLARGYTVHAMTRKPESPAAKALAKIGAGIVKADLDDASSLETVLAGVWGVYAVQNTWEAGVVKEEEQGIRLAELAKKAGVQTYVGASVASAHRSTAIPHFENKWRIEEKLRSLGFPTHVVLRPVFFMENFLGPFFLPGIQQGQLVAALDPETSLQMIAVADIGKYAAWAFDNATKLNGRAIDIAGDSKTMPETAAILSKHVGRPVEFVRAPIQQVREFSEDYALMLEWFDRVGYDVEIEANAKESGIHPTSLDTWAAGVDWKAPVTTG